MYINSLPSRLVRWFSRQEYLSDCVFLEAHGPAHAERPVTQPTVSIGSDCLTVETMESGATQRTAVTSFVARIHVPSRLGGSVCSDVAARISDALLFGTDLNIGAISSAPVRYIRNTDTICLEMSFAVSETLRQAYEWGEF